MSELTVSLSAQAIVYPIYIEAGLLADREKLWQIAPHRHICVVSDKRVASLYLDKLRATFEGRKLMHYLLPEGEEAKTLEAWQDLLSALLAQRFPRDGLIIALGGGAVSDVAGFAASCYQRGVDFIPIPTTLLSQVDASVGGKVAINHALAKNMIGHFHQPHAVIIDPNCLNALSDADFYAGLAEVVKIAAIADSAFFAFLEENAPRILAKEADSLSVIIERSCALKAAFVAQDTFDFGKRQYLNFGHTFGHALETLGDYHKLRHGEAVALGMRIAGEVSQAYCALAQTDVQRLNALLTALHLPKKVDFVDDPKDVLAIMRLDKKIAEGKNHFILLSALGQAQICSDVPEAVLLEAIQSAL